MKNYSVYLNEDGKGFIHGGKINVIPQSFSSLLREVSPRPISDYKVSGMRSISLGKAMNGAPVYAELTANGILKVSQA
jgi:hypothetical protein